MTPNGSMYYPKPYPWTHTPPSYYPQCTILCWSAHIDCILELGPNTFLTLPYSSPSILHSPTPTGTQDIHIAKASTNGDTTDAGYAVDDQVQARDEDGYWQDVTVVHVLNSHSYMVYSPQDKRTSKQSAVFMRRKQEKVSFQWTPHPKLKCHLIGCRLRLEVPDGSLRDSFHECFPQSAPR